MSQTMLIDYDEANNLIKVHTTKDPAQAIAIPRETDTSLEKFESAFILQRAVEPARQSESFCTEQGNGNEISRCLRGSCWQTYTIDCC